MIARRQRRLHSRVLVHMLQHQSLADRRLVVDAFAAVPIAAGAHLEEEGAIDLVHLRAVDPRQPVSH